MQRTYELVYIVRPDATEQQVADLHTQVEQIVGRMGGALEKSDAQAVFGGRRKLAYEIGHHKEGIYVLEVIKGNGPCNAQRMAHRVGAHEDGAWVREAASAYATKQAASSEGAA